MDNELRIKIYTHPIEKNSEFKTELIISVSGADNEFYSELGSMADREYVATYFHDFYFFSYNPHILKAIELTHLMQIQDLIHRKVIK